MLFRSELISKFDEGCDEMNYDLGTVKWKHFSLQGDKSGWSSGILKYKKLIFDDDVISNISFLNDNENYIFKFESVDMDKRQMYMATTRNNGDKSKNVYYLEDLLKNKSEFRLSGTTSDGEDITVCFYGQLILPESKYNNEWIEKIENLINDSNKCDLNFMVLEYGNSELESTHRCTGKTYALKWLCAKYSLVYIGSNYHVQYFEGDGFSITYPGSSPFPLEYTSSKNVLVDEGVDKKVIDDLVSNGYRVIGFKREYRN